MSDFLILANNIQGLIDPATNIEATDLADDKILTWIEKRVQILLDTDFQSLIQALYRLDINENELRKAIDKNPPSGSARIISQMILEREKSKIKTRDEYKRFRASDEESDSERW